MKTTRIYLCEDSIDGIFAAVYDAGKSKYGHDFIKLELTGDSYANNMEFFAEYIRVSPDAGKTQKVLTSVREKIGIQVYHDVLLAAASNSPDKADVIYHYIVYGFAVGEKIRSALQIDWAERIFSMNRRVKNEAHYFKEFIRFREIRGSFPVLFSVIEPQNFVLSLVFPHFADRLNTENFIIYDKAHNEAVFYSPDRGSFLQKPDEAERERLLGFDKGSEEEAKLWKLYIDSISIKERENRNLQRNNLPLRYRKHMTEF